MRLPDADARRLTSTRSRLRLPANAVVATALALRRRAGNPSRCQVAWHPAPAAIPVKNLGAHIDTNDVRGRIDDLGDSTWAFAVLCASAESGLLAALASPRRVNEAAETAGLPVDIAARILEVLVALGFVRRSGDGYESVDGLRPMLSEEAITQLLANLRTTYQQPR
jgi:hypothetical protein